MNSGVKPIVVIGAGIVGVSTALWLQRDGHEVVLVDREGPAAGTSHGNGGVLASCGVVPINAVGLMKTAPGMLLQTDSPLFLRWSYLPRMLPWLFSYLNRANKRDTELTAKALTAILYDSLEQHQALAKGTAAEKWLKPSDYVFAYQDREAFEKDSYSWALRRQLGYKWQELEGEAFRQYDGFFGGTRNFGVRFSDHGTITDPGEYVKALAGHFIQQGGKLVTANVRDIRVEDGAVTGVVCDSETIDCGKLVLAAGVWSKAIGEKLGLKVPMETERGYHIELVNPSIMPRAPYMLASGKFVVTPMEGRIRCAGIVEFGGLEAEASSAPIALLKKQISKVVPHLKYDSVVEWMGHRPAPSDSIPLIGPHGKIKDVYAGFGHHHIGLTGGPKTGRLLAEMISGRKSNIDLEPYKVSRFTH